MSERKRLIDMLAHVGNMRIMRCGLEECADYMLANGVIVSPCKVGDKVYYLCRDQETYEWYICEREVYSISVYENSTHIYVSPIISFAEIQIGVLVFLTKEEAEKALAERNRHDTERSD